MDIRFEAYLRYCKNNNIDTNTFPYYAFINKFISRIKAKYFRRRNHILIAGYLSDYGHKFFTRYLTFISKIKTL
jgi:hypothetical protein